MQIYQSQAFFKQLSNTFAVNFQFFTKSCLRIANLLVGRNPQRQSKQLPQPPEDKEKQQITQEKPKQPTQPAEHSQPEKTIHEIQKQKQKQKERQKAVQQEKNRQMSVQLHESTFSDSQISQVIQHFAKDLRIQILAKHPNAPTQKIDKVIRMKWDGLDPVKRDAYIKKINKRMLQKKLQQQRMISQQHSQYPSQNQSCGESTVKQQYEQAIPPTEPEKRFENYVNRIQQRQPLIKESKPVETESNNQPIAPQPEPIQKLSQNQTVSQSVTHQQQQVKKQAE